MKRKINWPNILMAEIRDSYTKKFVWGETDCVKWSFSVVNNLVEDTIEPPVQWSTEDEAKALLAEKSLKVRMIELFGEPQVLAKTQRGDFVYFKAPGCGETLGICAGDKAVFISSKGGIVTKNLLDCKYSWSTH